MKKNKHFEIKNLKGRRENIGFKNSFLIVLIRTLSCVSVGKMGGLLLD
jgi:hypothetical protein